MINTIEYYPVEVVKEFMSLTVGDILRVNPKTGNYELYVADEDIGEGSFITNEYYISLEPWIIEKYMDYFQVYEESVLKGQEARDVPELENADIELDESCDNFIDIEGEVKKDPVLLNKGQVIDMTSVLMDLENNQATIYSLKEDLEKFKQEFERLKYTLPSDPHPLGNFDPIAEKIVPKKRAVKAKK